jgi:steroid delta-isomerase-like uncharacterized protein
MSPEENKDLNLRWIQAFNERDWVTESACRTPDYKAHMSGVPSVLDSDGWMGFMSAFTAALPDARISVASSLAEGDVVASRWTITGTHQGEFQGVPATGRPVTLTGIDFSRVVDGKIAEHWAQFDLVGMLQQIGAIPVPA